MKHGNVKNYRAINKEIGREKIKVGNGTYFTGNDQKIYLWEGFENSDEKSDLIIKKYVSIASNVKFIMGGNHRHDWFAQSLIMEHSDAKKDELTSSGDIVIGNDVWIGYNATILSGTFIPDGCVIGANATVKGYNYEPYDIIVGNPGKSIKKRFNDYIIKSLLDIEWWNWDDEKMKKYSHLLKSNNIEELLKINE